MKHGSNTDKKGERSETVVPETVRLVELQTQDWQAFFPEFIRVSSVAKNALIFRKR